MGWSYTYEDYQNEKDYVEAAIVRGAFAHEIANGDLTIEHFSRCRGEVYLGVTWKGVRHIYVFLVEQFEGRWGHKAMNIAEGPYAHNCPEKMLKWYEEGTAVIPQYAADFIKRCRKERAEKAAKRNDVKEIKKLPIGTLVMVRGCDEVFELRRHNDSFLPKGQCQILQVQPPDNKLYRARYTDLILHTGRAGELF